MSCHRFFKLTKRSCGECNHKYKPRYDYKLPDKLKTTDKAFSSVNEAIRFLNAASSKTYVCDICEKCGNKIDRPEGSKHG